MAKVNIKREKRIRRHARIRTRISGTALRPRLAIFRSNRFMYVQLIDDESNKTIASASSLKSSGKKAEASFKIGQDIAKKASDLKITGIVFDRGGFGFKGRVEALARGAREGGLMF